MSRLPEIVLVSIDYYNNDLSKEDEPMLLLHNNPTTRKNLGKDKFAIVVLAPTIA